MAGINKSGFKGKVNLISELPPGEEHIKCREVITNADIPDKNGLTPLMFAVKEEHKRCVYQMIKAGVDVNAAGNDGSTPLMIAIDNENPNFFVAALISAGANVNAQDEQGFTPLMLAIDNENLDLIDMLIDAGADVNKKGKDGNTPSNFAVFKHNERCLNLLIYAGADMNIVNGIGDTPLLTSLKLEGNRKISEALVNTGADVNYSNKEGETALIRSVRMAYTTFVPLLIAAGADVNIKDNNDCNALHLAIIQKQLTTIEMLLKAGADVNSSNLEGESPLISLVCETAEDCYKTMNKLIEAGADVNAQSNNGGTVLIYTAIYGLMKGMETLVKAGVDVNADRDKGGRTALFYASYNGEDKCIDILLKAGADVNITADDDSTALHIEGNLEYDDYKKRLLKYQLCAKRLLRAGIHMNKFNTTEGKNALGILLGYKFKYQDVGLICGMKCINTIKLLYAAGEKLEGATEEEIPEELKFEDEKLQLKHICREAIRKHLLKLDPHPHLFGRIPKLGLPSALNSYLLFNMSLDDDDDDDDDNTNDSDDDYFNIVIGDDDDELNQCMIEIQKLVIKDN